MATHRARGRAQDLAASFGEIFQSSFSGDDSCTFFSGVGDSVSNWNSFGIAPIQERMSFLIVDLENGVAQLHRYLPVIPPWYLCPPRQAENTAFKNFSHPSRGGIKAPPEGGSLALGRNWLGFHGDGQADA